MTLPTNYYERVYSGVLGKIIGVYLGRPFEGWSHERIERELGEIRSYVHERLGVPLIVTDDDISGTFTFLRALADYEYDPTLTSRQIGQSWLNYIIEERAILWWGGLGNSTEHTAFLRLKQGIPAPESGSSARNGQVVAEQIGAQIFIDGWAMVAPSNPKRAADLARRAASVSHDGVAVEGACLLAAMESAAFGERNIQRLIDIGLSTLPADTLLRRLVADIRDWHAQDPQDWRRSRARIAERYGYDTYPGNCHIVPNHALIIHALLHGDGDFRRSLMIVNTSGWDTDCNSGNLGCLLGIRGGLATFDSCSDLRDPVADRLYLPTADGGRSISDALREADEIVAIGRALADEPAPLPKAGARFHFSLPGAVQGFASRDLRVQNLVRVDGSDQRVLALGFSDLSPDRPQRASTPTFIPSEAVARYFESRGYALLASPSLYPGQRVRAGVALDAISTAPVSLAPYLVRYGGDDSEQIVTGPEILLEPGQDGILEWAIPGSASEPIAQIGLQVRGKEDTSGRVELDWLTWDGEAEGFFGRSGDGEMWRRAWVDGLDIWHRRGNVPFHLIQNEGTGLLITGTREWRNYRARATITPHLCRRAGIAVRVQGMRRYYALLLAEGKVQLIKALDGERILAEAELEWRYEEAIELDLAVEDARIVGRVNGHAIFKAEDDERALGGGGVAFVVQEGRITSEGIAVSAAGPAA